MFRAGMTRSVSSANLIISFPSVTGWRSDAPTLYEAGPSPDPWMKLAVMYSKSDSSPASKVLCEWPDRCEMTQL